MSLIGLMPGLAAGCLCCRRLAHAKVLKEKRQKAAKEAAEGTKKEVGWLEWLRGGSAAAASGGQQSAIDKLSGPSAGAAPEVRCLQLAAPAAISLQIMCGCA
jgi:hypothetical protein